MSAEIQGLKPPDTPTQYRAIGFLRATYLPSADNFSRGTLATEDGKLFPAVLNGLGIGQLKKNPEKLGDENIWIVWPRKIQDSPSLVFSVKCLVEYSDEARQQEITASADYFSIRGQLWKWDEEDGKLVIKIKRNANLAANSSNKKSLKPFYLEIKGSLPVEKERGQFWELKCLRSGEALLLEDGRMILNADELKELEENPPELAQKEIKMTEARAEITLKFNTIPEVRTLPKSRVKFYLKATNGVVFTVNIKGKSWRKAEASMKEFPEWVAMVGGKLGNPTSNGFEIESAGLQVFEKKPKEPKQTEEKEEAVSRASAVGSATTTTDKITA